MTFCSFVVTSCWVGRGHRIENPGCVGQGQRCTPRVSKHSSAFRSISPRSKTAFLLDGCRREQPDSVVGFQVCRATMGSLTQQGPTVCTASQDRELVSTQEGSCPCLSVNRVDIRNALNSKKDSLSHQSQWRVSSKWPNSQCFKIQGLGKTWLGRKKSVLGDVLRLNETLLKVSLAL